MIKLKWQTDKYLYFQFLFMDIGKVQPTEITREMEKSYLDYAMSVIVSRALPDVRDGLKPVHRRILYSMHQMGLSPASKRTKSAKVVGDCMGKYHPHGDAAIYDALVRMAQDFSMRYPLVSGQGNFGSTDGDPPAAMRYTEVKLAPISQEMLTDIEKNTVEFTDNFDATLKEPLFLPAKLPNLLLMGAEGIAVGMATKIPPHNLGEVVEALIFMIDHGKISNIPPPTSKFESDVSTDQLLKFVKGPDFPTGGEIYDIEEIKNAYATGRGKIIVRGKAEIEEARKKFSIIIRQLPYQVNKSSLVAKIAQLVRDKKINGVADIRDESDRRGIRVVVELKRGSRPKAILNSLYEYTELQTTFPCNFVVLVDGVPKTLNLKQILTCYIYHRQEIVTKRSIFELEQSKKRAHVLEGLKIALKFLDEVIATIKKSKTVETAKTNLMEKFKLTEIQAQAILDMQLKKLAHLEQQKLQDEYQMVQETIAYLTDLLAHPQKILKVIRGELKQLAKKYADGRRTEIFPQKLGEFKKEDLIPKEEVIITTTEDGYIKRLPVGIYKTQRRGGKGVIGMTIKQEDKVADILTASTHDEILFFTNTGRVFSQKVHQLPEGPRRSKGQAIVNLIDLREQEKITAILPINLGLVAHDIPKATSYLLMATQKGTVKRTKIADFANIRSTGIIALKLKKGDQLGWVKPTKGDNQVMLITSFGKSIRFQESDVRSMGRTAAGVRGIKLKKGDFVTSCEVFLKRFQKPKDKRRKSFYDLLVVSQKGLGKRTPIELFPVQKRGGVGVKVAKVTQKTGAVIASQLTTQKDKQVVLTSRLGQVIKLPLKNIPQLGRNTQGVILMRFTDPKDSVAAMTTI